MDQGKKLLAGIGACLLLACMAIGVLEIRNHLAVGIARPWIVSFSSDVYLGEMSYDIPPNQPRGKK